MSKYLERYNDIRQKLSGMDYNESALEQYLHIAQVMAHEEKSYERHRKEMAEWLKNIERSIYNSAKHGTISTE